MKLDLCVFDMDGLLIDSEKGMWRTSQKKAIKIMGKEYDEEFFRSMMGCKYTLGCEKLIEHYGLDFDPVYFYKLVFDFNEEQIKNGIIPLMPGATELLEYLKKNNIKRTIATSTIENVATRILHKTGLDYYFDVITFGNEVELSKPAPDIYIKAISKFNCKPENALVFEDAHTGAQAALSANIPLILVPDVAPITDEDINKSFAVIKSLDKAIEIIENIK